MELDIDIKPVDFAKSRGFAHGTVNQKCPLQNALKREGYDLPGDVQFLYVDVGNDTYYIPTWYWGASTATFSPDRVDKLARWSKNPFLKHFVPTVHLTLSTSQEKVSKDYHLDVQTYP